MKPGKKCQVILENKKEERYFRIGARQWDGKSSDSTVYSFDNYPEEPIERLPANVIKFMMSETVVQHQVVVGANFASKALEGLQVVANMSRVQAALHFVDPSFAQGMLDGFHRQLAAGHPDHFE